MKYLPNVFVILLSAGFGLMMFLWQKEVTQLQEKTGAYQAVILELLELGAKNNQSEATAIMQGIDDEIANHGIKQNEGLKDTIQLILEGRKQLFEMPHPSAHSILQHFELLRDIPNSMLRPKHHLPIEDFQKFTHPTTLDDELIWKKNILKMEKMALEVCEARTGSMMLYCPRLLLFNVPKKSERIIAGETFESEIFVTETTTKYHTGAKLSVNVAPTFYQITKNNFTHTLSIPTKGLLPMGQSSIKIPYHIEYQIRKASGGYETIIAEQEFTVVAPCETP